MFRVRGAKVSVTKYRFLQQLLAPKLRDQTPESLHRSLEKPSEPLSASTVWGNTKQLFDIARLDTNPLRDRKRAFQTFTPMTFVFI